jgi:hypothetical protein
MNRAAAALLFAIPLVAATSSQEPTFNKDVLPILQNRCQSCHRAGEIGPMPLVTYKDARPWAKSIREAVSLRRMPPWFADPKSGHFANDPSLTKAEIDTLVAWANTGAKEGNPKDAPMARAVTDGWSIGKPDLVLEMPAEFQIPAAGTIDYQHFIVPTNFTEDKWVTAVEFRPSNRSVVHHTAVFVRPPGSRWMRDKKTGEQFGMTQWSRGMSPYDEIIGGYVPGNVPEGLKPGQAALIKAGSDLVLQVHYTATGKPAADRSRVGIIFAKEAPKERVYSIQAANPRLVIPPGADNFEASAKLTLQEDSTLLALSPHMHLRGKSFEFKAYYPDGTSETLLNVPNYKFTWQLTYELAEPKRLPKGTRIECIAHFDNSANNATNPDPTAEVRWGDQSWNEMLVGVMSVAVPPSMDVMDLFRLKKAESAGLN